MYYSSSCPEPEPELADFSGGTFEVSVVCRALSLSLPVALSVAVVVVVGGGMNLLAVADVLNDPHRATIIHLPLDDT